MAKRTRHRKPRPTASADTAGLGKLTVADLHAELARRERRRKSLLQQRDRLMAKLDAVNSQLAVLGGLPTEGRTRPRNDATLVDALAALLADKELSVTDAADEVQKAGYMTTSPSFRTIVNQTLINYPKRFKRVSRGVYTAKG